MALLDNEVVSQIDVIPETAYESTSGSDWWTRVVDTSSILRLHEAMTDAGVAASEKVSVRQIVDCIQTQTKRKRLEVQRDDQSQSYRSKSRRLQYWPV
jgi:hypothetical protein